jgi:hypothetical protein
LKPSKYYPELQWAGLLPSGFLAAIFLGTAYKVYPTGYSMHSSEGRISWILIMVILVAIGVGLMMIAVYYLSDMFIRKIIVTDQAILDQRGFPLATRTIPRSLVHTCRIEIAERDKAKPGLEEVHLSWKNLVGTGGSTGVLRGYAKQQNLILLGKGHTIVGKINLYGF